MKEYGSYRDLRTSKITEEDVRCILYEQNSTERFKNILKVGINSYHVR